MSFLLIYLPLPPALHYRWAKMALENNKHVFVLFDTVPGGAGHVKRLLNKQEMLKAFQYAYEKVSQNCCDVACYNCIKNYKNQKYHEFLRRPLAKDFLDKIIQTFDK